MPSVPCRLAESIKKKKKKKEENWTCKVAASLVGWVEVSQRSSRSLTFGHPEPFWPERPKPHSLTTPPRPQQTPACHIATNHSPNLQRNHAKVFPSLYTGASTDHWVVGTRRGSSPNLTKDNPDLTPNMEKMVT